MTFIFIFFILLLSSSIISEHIWEVNENQNKESIRYGDMILTPSQLSRYSSHSSLSTLPPIRGGAVITENSYNRWPNNTIPYLISSQYSNTNSQYIRSSLQSLQSLSCFKFIERTTEHDYIQISPLDGCYSFVGRVGGRQPVSLSLDCMVDYIIWHEILHVLGFEHEHQRPDRDEFIQVQYKNVQKGQMVNFEKLKPHTVELTEPYDYRSIMHYDGNAFGKYDTRLGRRLATMIPTKKSIQLKDNTAFSESDLKKLRALGNCEDFEANHDSCDDLSTICEKVASRGFCNDEAYYSFLKDDCKKSCGWCSNERTLNTYNDKVPNCIDELPNCEFLSQSGFCTNPFYKNHRYKCSKSCRLC